MNFYFSKEFNVYNLKIVDYWKCRACGFVASKTHFDMEEKEWQKLNLRFHEDNNKFDNPYNRNQRYFHQALMLHLMKKFGLLPSGKYLDWGSGTGRLSDRMETLFDMKIYNFDKYLKPASNALPESQLVKRGYALVCNTGVFEHVRCRKTLDGIESFVSPEGCLAVHTLVRGEIPNNPEWMYLLPVHCAFHTNTSMQRLMSEWGYTCSVYNENAKLWCMFRASPDEVAAKVSLLNDKLGWVYLHFKTGFMDYWP